MGFPKAGTFSWFCFKVEHEGHTVHLCKQKLNTSSFLVSFLPRVGQMF